MSRKKRVLAICFFAIITIIVLSTVYACNALLGSNFKNTEAAYVYVDSDDDVDSLCAKLAEASGRKDVPGFGVMASVLGLDESGALKTGRYELLPDDSVLGFLRKVRNHSQSPVRLVVPSVRTMDELAARLSERLMLDSTVIASALKNDSICNSLGYTVETIPALFIPNTYEVYWDMSLDGLLSRMKRENASFWTEDRLRKANETGLTKEEIITLASIVDEETANNAEKPRVAGLYINRLHLPMPLQSDPTVKFALGDFSLRRILHAHLEVDSPYNTYRNEGLPPGPIRIPSIAGIDAVLNYEHHPYIYMCAKEDFSGTHNFARSYSEHLVNARKYTDALNKRGIK